MSLKKTIWNDKQIWDYLMSKINNAYGVAGLCGNIKAESNYRSNNLQNTGETRLGVTDDEYTNKVDDGSYSKDSFVYDKFGFGLVQHTYWSRKANLYDYCKSKNASIADTETQLEFIINELKAYGLLDDLQNAKSIREASDKILLQYEKPADQSESVQVKRCSYGEEIYNKYANTSSATQTPSNSSLVTYTRITKHKTSPRQKKIDTITIHCIVGQWTAKQGCDYFATTTRECSANYVVGKDGSIGLSVDEKDRSWCTSNANNDHRAITIEVASDTTHPYAVTDEALAALIKLCADICKRNGIKELKWSTNKNDRVNHLNGCNMTVHRDYANKACPGEYLYNKHQYIADEVNRILNVNVPTPTPTPQPTTPTTNKFKVGDIVNYKGNVHYTSANSDSPKACKGGEAKVTQTYKGKHPYHLVRVEGKGASVYGWVDEKDIEAITKKEETYRTHTVQKGDSLWGIAQKYLGKGQRYTEIMNLNGLKSTTIYSGMILKIPNK